MSDKTEACLLFVFGTMFGFGIGYALRGLIGC